MGRPPPPGNYDNEMPPEPAPRLPSESHLSPQVAYVPNVNHPYAGSTGINDPRSSSDQSLHPVESAGEDKRKLLLVYIHGFLGAEASFKSFPAHVHSLLTIYLADSHVVHTKIYPRYRSRKNISIARDNFSNWLYPHEGPNTDIVLLGHSLGGILSAEVVLIPCHVPGSIDLLQHRILGQVAFDTPFLGMHPSVVPTGIASLFRSAPEESTSNVDDEQSEILSLSSNDPNNNPTYSNDVHLPVRKNALDRARYFWNKHTDNMTTAVKSYVMSYFEFGGCLLDYNGLRKRYEAIRALEDVNELNNPKGPHGKLMRRVRFINYYTASTGRLKPPKPPDQGQLIAQTEMKTMESQPVDLLAVDNSGANTPRISLEEHRESAIIDKTSELKLDADPSDSLKHKTLDIVGTTSEADNRENGPVQTTHDREVTDQIYQPDRGDGSNDPEKPQQQQQNREELKRRATLNLESYDKHVQSEGQPEKKKKDRKFCSLPSKDSRTGARDATWVRVYMEGMDEVVAHTSLFNFGETYAKLVGDTAERIAEWVHDDATTQALLRERANTSNE